MFTLEIAYQLYHSETEPRKAMPKPIPCLNSMTLNSDPLPTIPSDRGKLHLPGRNLRPSLCGRCRGETNGCHGLRPTLCNCEPSPIRMSVLHETVLGGEFPHLKDDPGDDYAVELNLQATRSSIRSGLESYSFRVIRKICSLDSGVLRE